MWRFVSFVTETTTKPRLFECFARVTRIMVEVTKLEPNIRLIILFLLNTKHNNNIYYVIQNVFDKIKEREKDYVTRIFILKNT